MSEDLTQEEISTPLSPVTAYYVNCGLAPGAVGQVFSGALSPLAVRARELGGLEPC